MCCTPGFNTRRHHYDEVSEASQRGQDESSFSTKLPYQPLTRSGSSPSAEVVSTFAQMKRWAIVLYTGYRLHTRAHLKLYLFATKRYISSCILLMLLSGISASCCATLVDFLTRTGRLQPDRQRPPDQRVSSGTHIRRATRSISWPAVTRPDPTSAARCYCKRSHAWKGRRLLLLGRLPILLWCPWRLLVGRLLGVH